MKRSGPPSRGLGEMLTNPFRKNSPCYEMLQRASDLERCFGMIQAFESGHGIWNVEFEESL